MADTGAPWNIPYVAGSDLVADWPTDNQTMAEAIADALDLANTIPQVVSASKTDTFSTASNSLTPVTGLRATITPGSATNKVLIIARVSIAPDAGVTGASSALLRDGTPIHIGDAASPRGQSSSASQTANDNYQMDQVMVYLDSPATTSAINYDVAVTNAQQNASTIYVNRSKGDGASTFIWRTTSSITAIEVTA